MEQFGKVNRSILRNGIKRIFMRTPPDQDHDKKARDSETRYPCPSCHEEWVDPNHVGGYASLSATMLATRRQHGLFVATPPGHSTLHLFLSRLEEHLIYKDETFCLSQAAYKGLNLEDRHPYLVEIQSKPYPRFTYKIDEVLLIREIISTSEPGLLSRYRIEGSSGCQARMRLRALTGFREANRLTFENVELAPQIQRQPDGFRMRPYAQLPAMEICIDADHWIFEADPLWYRQIEYPIDLSRGYDGHEDQFSPGYFLCSIRPGKPILLYARLIEDIKNLSPDRREARSEVRSMQPVQSSQSAMSKPKRINLDQIWRISQSARESSSRRSAPRSYPWLDLAAEDFFYQTPSGRRGIIAGFPWFGEWGRDTFIALPGLTLARDKIADCRAILDGTIPFVQDGLVPNIFGESPKNSRYNSVDAALWFARSIDLYDRATNNQLETAATFAPILLNIAEHYRRGLSGLKVRFNDFALLELNDPSGNLTWMDAQTSTGPVTPRIGCPVEINALWYALLCSLSQMLKRLHQSASAANWSEVARQCSDSFMACFWIQESGYLADTWSEGRVDPRIRPNMVIAASLAHSPLQSHHRLQILRRVDEELLTPKGLRTLSPQDPEYQGMYQGAPDDRDQAYHQGTVWPWLIGFWVEAKLRSDNSAQAKKRLREYIQHFLVHHQEAGLGQISEIFDGDAPHRARGTIAQAWSVGEMLRAIHMLDQESM